VVFGYRSVEEVYPEWWGAVGDSLTDDTDAIQAAFDSVYATQLELFADCSYFVVIPVVFSRIYTINPISIRGIVSMIGKHFPTFSGSPAIFAVNPAPADNLFTLAGSEEGEAASLSVTNLTFSRNAVNTNIFYIPKISPITSAAQSTNSIYFSHCHFGGLASTANIINVEECNDFEFSNNVIDVGAGVALRFGIVTDARINSNDVYNVVRFFYVDNYATGVSTGNTFTGQHNGACYTFLGNRDSTNVPVAGAVPASTVERQNTYTYPVVVRVGGGTVTDISTGPTSGALVSTGEIGGAFILEADEYIAITYSSVPSWTWKAASTGKTSFTITGNKMEGNQTHYGILVSGSGNMQITSGQNIYDNLVSAFYDDDYAYTAPMEIKSNGDIFGADCINRIFYGVGYTSQLLYTGDVYPTYGTTAERPILVEGNAGFTYWDTTISQMLTWNGTAWTPADVVTPAVPASTVAANNANAFPVRVTITGGTVTVIAIGPTGATVDTGANSGAVILQPGWDIAITYSVAPTWAWLGM
jgi:hypothetical protein